MSIVKMTKDHGYGQLELNNCAFRRDGRIEAQCKIGDGISYLENGMLLAVDAAKRTVGFATENTGLIAINYTSEHMYSERENALKNFKLEPGTFLPRLGYLAKGDKYTTNTVEYDTTDYANAGAIKEGISAGTVYAVPSTDGYHKLVNGSSSVPTGAIVAKAIAYTTMPDGSDAIKFIVVNA